ncbi:MAG: glycine cleavage system protein GcvH [Tissierellia bacterium]|nr:glycine cleavage system protein GcvH [Tissierellia bacterium]
MKIEQGLFYTKDHEWVKVEGDVATVGIADYAQEHLGDIIYVELPDVDDEFDKGEAFSSVESVKAATDVFLPVAGTITEVNEELEDEPGLLNQDAYANWIVKIKVSDPDTSDLMDAAQYEAFVKEL